MFQQEATILKLSKKNVVSESKKQEKRKESSKITINNKNYLELCVKLF
jgi:hypothetical protein